MDRQGALINLILMAFGTVHVAAKWWDEPLCMYVVLLMTLVAALQLCQYALAAIGCNVSQQYRTACTVVIQSLQLALTIEYIPAIFQVAKGTQLASGKQGLLAGNALLTAVATFHIAMHSAAGRLPLRHAAPFVLTKVAVSIYFLQAKQIELFSIPAVGAVVSAMKRRVDSIYNAALAAAAVSGCWPLPNFPPPPCANTCLALWLHICVAGLLPLYVIAVHDVSHRSASTSSRSSSSSRPSSSRGQTTGQQQQQQQSTYSCSALFDSLFICARHGAILFGASMFLWAAVDSLASLPTVNAWFVRNALCA
jgi:hypothetical protein